MREILSKFPYNIQESWRKNVYEMSEKKSLNVNFNHLCEFIEKETTIANDLMYGKICLRKKKKNTFQKIKSIEMVLKISLINIGIVMAIII